MTRFKRHLYLRDRIKFTRSEGFTLVESDDGTLFAGKYRTKIYAHELPEWYVFGRYYREWGYMSTKGIKDLLYIPNMHINHFLRDDCLLISYEKKIMENPNPKYSPLERYIGVDQRVWGSGILNILKGAQIYSGYDISGILEQIKEKQQWLKEAHPRDYEHEAEGFDVDKWSQEEFYNGHPPKFFALTLYDCFSPAFVSGTKKYYGTMDDIKSFIESLDPEKFKETVAAFKDYMSGNEKASHSVAYAKHQLLQPVTLIKKSAKYEEGPAQWDFKNVWGCTYVMMRDGHYSDIALIQDGDRYIRCFRPTINGLKCNDDICSANWLTIDHFWGHPQVLTYKHSWQSKPYVEANLYFSEREYEDIKQAVSEFETEPLDLNIVCEDIFADG